jgi:hypothetical protein
MAGAGQGKCAAILLESERVDAESSRDAAVARGLWRRRSTRGPAQTRRATRALLVVAAAAMIAAKQPDSDEHDVVEQLAVDLKDSIREQLRAGRFNSDAIGQQLQHALAKTTNSGRRQGVNGTLPADIIAISDFQCKSCLFTEEGTLRPIIAMFMDDESTCHNPTAAKLLENRGLTLDACNFRKTAIPECFVADNWDSGWICQVTHGIFRDMGLPVIAKTQANSTVPLSVYSGSSAYTRCVYEVKTQAVDVCIGNFWETAERRALVPFTTAIDVDKMYLISMPKGGLDAVTKYSPWLPDSSLLWTWTLPFEWEVWLASVVTILVAALSMWAVELGREQYREPGAKYYDGSWAFPYKLWLAALGTLHRPPTCAVVEEHASSDVNEPFARPKQAVTWAGMTRSEL